MGVVCIHDTLNANHTAVYAKTENKENKKRDSVVAVSYTHLTLPTILLV